MELSFLALFPRYNETLAESCDIFPLNPYINPNIDGVSLEIV